PLPAVARAGRRRRSFAATPARGESRDPLTPARVRSQKFGEQREGGAGGAPAGTVASAGGRSEAHDAVARSRRRDAPARGRVPAGGPPGPARLFVAGLLRQDTRARRGE